MKSTGLSALFMMMTPHMMTLAAPADLVAAADSAVGAAAVETVASNKSDCDNDKECIWRRLLDLGLVRQTTVRPSLMLVVKEDEEDETSEGGIKYLLNSILTFQIFVLHFSKTYFCLQILQNKKTNFLLKFVTFIEAKRKFKFQSTH
jgi:hypothetical protein